MSFFVSGFRSASVPTFVFSDCAPRAWGLDSVQCRAQRREDPGGFHPGLYTRRFTYAIEKAVNMGQAHGAVASLKAAGL